MKNSIHAPRTPSSQKDYDQWKLKVLLAVNGEGISAERVAKFFDCDIGRVRKMATKQGVSLSTRGKKQ